MKRLVLLFLLIATPALADYTHAAALVRPGLRPRRNVVGVR